MLLKYHSIINYGYGLGQWDKDNVYYTPFIKRSTCVNFWLSIKDYISTTKLNPCLHLHNLNGILENKPNYVIAFILSK